MTARTGHELSPAELAAWRGLLRVHRRLIAELDAEMRAEHGIPVSSYEVLLFLASAPDERMRMSDLATRVLLSKSGLTRLVDRLVERDWVERDAAPDDARGAYAVLTDAGRRRFREAQRTHLAGVRKRFLERFSEEELEQLGGFWERVLPGAAS